jgi:hypothetical protein
MQANRCIGHSLGTGVSTTLSASYASSVQPADVISCMKISLTTGQ